MPGGRGGRNTGGCFMSKTCRYAITFASVLFLSGNAVRGGPAPIPTMSLKAVEINGTPVTGDQQHIVAQRGDRLLSKSGRVTGPSTFRTVFALTRPWCRVASVRSAEAVEPFSRWAGRPPRFRTSAPPTMTASAVWFADSTSAFCQLTIPDSDRTSILAVPTSYLPVST